MAAYRQLDDLVSPVHRDQLRAQRSVSSMGKPFKLDFPQCTFTRRKPFQSPKRQWENDSKQRLQYKSQSNIHSPLSVITPSINNSLRPNVWSKQLNNYEIYSQVL